MASRYRFLIRRILQIVPTVLLAATLIFFLANVIPGDIGMVILGLDYPEWEALEALRERLGLHLPVHIRYVNWMIDIFTKGDLGISLMNNIPVTQLIRERLPVTLSVSIGAMLLAIIIAIPAGIISATRRESKADITTSIVSLLGLSIPSFFLGIILILVFSVWLRILPAAQYVPIMENPIEWLRHLILPIFTMGTILAAQIMRFTRSSLLEVMAQEYVVTARAKGLTEKRVIYKHALKNALIPVLTVIGIQTGYMLGGTIVVETLFSMPGLGTLMVQGAMNRDFMVVAGTAFALTSIFIIINLIVDLIYTYADPRIRFD